jgi:hypothetical protein
LPDQCLQALHALGSAPALLIYDSVRSAESVLPWLPPTGMPCHVLIMTVVDRWDSGWLSLEVEPLSPATSLSLIEEIADHEIAGKYGPELARLAAGLPVQICPAAATLVYEERRGRDSVQLTLTREAEESFRGVFEQLDAPAQLLLRAAAPLNPQRILREELFRHLGEPTGWSEVELERLLDACLDLHLLEGGAEFRMHHLFAPFLLASDPEPEVAATLKQVRRVRARRLAEIAGELVTDPANTELAPLSCFSPSGLRPGWMQITGSRSKMEKPSAVSSTRSGGSTMRSPGSSARSRPSSRGMSTGAWTTRA